MGRRVCEKAAHFVRRGNRQRLRSLLRKHPYLLDSDQAFLVHTACWHNRSMLPWLLKRGVSPDSRLGCRGNTPLMQAAGDGDIWAMSLLIDHGAAIEATNEDGETPLGYAVTYEHPEAVRLLAAVGANINGTEGTNKTYLDWALLSGWEEIADALRSLGAKRVSELPSTP
jgi:ankyrin repeat protein